MRLTHRLYSWALLAWHLLVHFVRLLFRRPGEGERRVIANYRAEGLLPLLPEERAWIADADRCIGCGLCDAVCPGLRGGVPRHAFGGPMFLALAARSFPDLPAMRAHLDADLACGPCTACERVCPTGVPLARLSDLCRAYLTRLEG